MLATKRFGKFYVSVAYDPDWKGNSGTYYGDGKTTWEVAVGDGVNLKILPHQTRQQVNTLLKNYSRGIQPSFENAEVAK